MPGTVLLGARYYQEIAPDVAMDRAEIVGMGQVIQTPAGDFTDTLITQETTALEPNELEFKYYAAWNRAVTGRGPETSAIWICSIREFSSIDRSK